MGLCVTWSSWRCPSSLQRGWRRWPSKVPSKPNYSISLWPNEGWIDKESRPLIDWHCSCLYSPGHSWYLYLPEHTAGSCTACCPPRPPGHDHQSCSPNWQSPACISARGYLIPCQDFASVLLKFSDVLVSSVLQLVLVSLGGSPALEHIDWSAQFGVISF